MCLCVSGSSLNPPKRRIWKENCGGYFYFFIAELGGWYRKGDVGTAYNNYSVSQLRFFFCFFLFVPKKTKIIFLVCFLGPYKARGANPAERGESIIKISASYSPYVYFVDHEKWSTINAVGPPQVSNS